MKYYFTLQFNILCRHIKANGIHPLFAFTLLLIAFIFLSLSLLKQSAYAVYLYTFIPFTFLPALGSQKRNEFLRITFSKKRLQQLRIAENLLIVFPFAMVLIIKQQLILGILLVTIACFFSLITFKTSKSTTIPTPFHRFPFEFPSGFRKTFIGIIISYILLIIGISFGNMNLAFVSTALLFLVQVSYYSLPENEFFVWIHSKSPKNFLLSKIKIAILYSLYLTIPAILLLFIIFPSHYLIISGILAAGLLVVITSLLGKYALYPSEVNLAQTLSVIFSVVFPPIMIILLPIFYTTSINRLKPYFQ